MESKEYSKKYRQGLMTIMRKRDYSGSSLVKIMDMVVAAEDKEAEAKAIIRKIGKCRSEEEAMKNL